MVSTHDSASEVQAKVEEWLKAGARLVLVAYPLTRSMVVYRSPREAQVLSEGDTLDAAPVFDAFSLPVGELFRA